jgi:HK97 family phage prohead protease
MDRAYSTLVLKSVDDDLRVIEGVASTPSTDRMGDVVEPRGAQFKLPIPLLWQHDAAEPIGHVTAAKVTDAGIAITAKIAKGVLPRIDEAWALIKSGLVRGLSIGFQPLEAQDIKGSYGQRFTKWSWLELSAVTIAANQDASITAIKSIDERFRLAAPGRSAKPLPPGATGTSEPAHAGFFSSQAKGKVMKTMEMQLSELRETRERNAARMQELVETKEAEGRAFSAEERNEFEGLKASLPDLDDAIAVKAAQSVQARTAVAVETRAPMGFVRKQDPDDAFKGQAQTRRIIAKALASISAKNGDYVRPSEIAEARWGKTNPKLVAVMKANEVAGGGSGSGEAWAELVSADNRFNGDFIDFLYSKTVYDRLPLRSVPANVAIKGMDGAFTGYWTGESKAIKMSQGSGSSTSLTPLKVAALTVLSNELIRDSSPSAEMIVRDGLEEALRQVVDTKFLSADAASAGVSPAGILNGVSAKTSDGDDITSVYTDWKALMGDFITAKNTEGLYIVTTPTLATAISLMRNALGMPEFDGINTNGGTFQGVPALTGDNVGAGDFILLKPSEIWRIADTGVQVSVSQEATIEQSSAPVGATDTPTAMTEAFTSMFQEDSTAFKVVRSVNFLKRRSTAVSYVGDANYGSGVS